MIRIFSFLIVTLVSCQSRQSSISEQPIEKIQPIVEEIKQPQLEISDCLGLFERIDRDWIKENFNMNSTSTIENAWEYGFDEGKVGHYELMHNDINQIDHLGILKVRYFKKPWYTFSDDEIWFQFRIDHPALKLTEAIYVGIDMAIPKRVYKLKSVDDKWVYDSSCEILTIESDSLNRVKAYTIRKKF